MEAKTKSGRTVNLGENIALLCQTLKRRRDGKLINSSVKAIVLGKVLAIKFELNEKEEIMWTADVLCQIPIESEYDLAPRLFEGVSPEEILGPDDTVDIV